MMMSREEENDIAFVVDNDNDTPQTTTTTQQRPRRVVPFRRRRQPPLLLLPVGTLSCLWIVVVALLSLSSSVQQRRGTMMVSSFVLRPAPAVTPLPSSSYVVKRVPTTKNNRRLLPSAAVSSLSSTITETAVTTASTVNGESASAASASSWEDDNDTNAAADDVNIRLNVNEKARTVTAVCTSGTLCTVSSEPDIAGAPFGSFVDYVLDDEGNPVFLMNDRSMHTVNIRNAQENDDEKKALVTLFTQLGGGAGSPATTAAQSSSLGGGVGGGGGSSIRLQDVSRCSVTGTLERMSADTAPDWDAVRMRYSLTHAYADQVMDSPVFSFYRLRPAKIYFVGGFGVLAEWVDPADYAAAAPDILACEANSIMDRLHREHGHDLFLTAQQLLLRDDENDDDSGKSQAASSSPTIEKIRVTNVDRLGMDVRVTRQLSTRRNKLQTDEFRIGFRIPVLSVEDAKSEILKVFQEAWERANGVTWGSSEERPGDNVPIVKIAADALE